MFVLASQLGAKNFGAFVLVQTTALLFTTFCALNLGQMATKIVAESMVLGVPEQSRTVSVSYGVGVIGSSIMALALAAGSGILATKVGGNPQLSLAFGISSLLVITGFISAIQSGVALGLGVMKVFTVSNFLVAPLSIAAMAVAATWRSVTAGLVGYVIAQALVVLFQEVALTRALKARAIRRSLAGLHLKDWDAVWRLGIPSSVAGAFTLPSLWVAMVMLNHLPNGAVEVGKFGVANQFRSLMILGVGAVANAALPAFATARAKGETTDETKTAEHAFAMVLMITVVPAIILVLFGRPILSRVGPAYSHAIVELRLLAAAAIATGLTSIYMRMAMARDEAQWLIYGNAAFAVGLVGVAAITVRAGSVGISWAILAASILQFLVLAAGQDRRLRKR